MNAAGRKGSIMMEYAVALCGLSVVAAIFMNRVFFGIGEGFGPLGQQVVAFFQRLQGGLSLPIP